MRRADVIGVVTVIFTICSLVYFRILIVEPRAWGAACAAAPAPLACLPRAALLWLQHFYLWGSIAMALGVAAFLGAPKPFAIAALAVGIAAVINYNATYGMIGAALGLYVWFTQSPARAV